MNHGWVARRQSRMDSGHEDSDAVIRDSAIDLTALARVGTALADETRRSLLVSLLDGPRYPSELADELGLSRPNVSNHLACLRGCGLVVAEAEGRRQRYRLCDRRLAHALSDLCGLVLPPDPCAHQAGQ